MDVLYISYDGALDPLGRSQVVPYLEGLSARGHRFDLISFEKPARWADVGDRDGMKRRLTESGIRWRPLRYHKRVSPIATSYDLSRALLVARRLVRRRSIEIVHARSYPSALVAWRIARRFDIPFVFDMRGFYPEERVDGGIWPAGGALYRLAKRLESRFLRDAAAVVTLTEASLPTLKAMSDEARSSAIIAVIPTSVDLDRFRPAADAESFVLAYSGSIGTWYLLEEMLSFGRVVIERLGGRLRFVVNEETARVRDAALRAGIPPERLEVDSVSHEDVPRALAGVSATYAFIRPDRSKVASAATKVSESLALGLPVAVNAGIGDAADIIDGEHVGVVVDPSDKASFEDAARRLAELAADPTARARCRAVAERLFDLDTAVMRYDDLYSAISANRERARPKLVVLCPHPPDRAPAQRLKFEQYYPSWHTAGYDVDVRPFWSLRASEHLYESGRFGRKALALVAGFLRRVGDARAALRADLVYLFLEAAPLGPPLLERLIVRRRVPIVYDIDDLVHLPHSSRPNPFMRWLRNHRKIPELMDLADHVIVCTPYLEELAARHSENVTRISSTIDLERYRPRPRRPETGPVVVGWSGSHSTSPYLHILDDVLRDLQRSDGVRVKVIGDGGFRIDGAQVEAMPWQLESEVEDLSEIDVGVYPLPDEEWVLGKSGLKALQYMALGIPTVAQRVGANLEIIEDGHNGLLVASLDEWAAALRRLVRDPDLRTRLGDAGRATVAARYSVAVTEPTYLKVLSSVAGTRTRRGPSRSL